VTPISAAEFEARYAALAGRLPDAAEYQDLATRVLDIPEAAPLRRADPYSAAYREQAMALWRVIRGDGALPYDPARDELAEPGPEPDPWTGVTPWSFRDPRFVAEFLYAWGHMLALLDLDSTKGGSVLEYGPGSGQFILLCARLGFEAHAVDIEPGFLRVIERQAATMGLSVATEQAVFGAGFGDRRFDRIVFFEAFHHAFDFLDLLPRLRSRLAPGGKLLLAGEPVVAHAVPSIPFPWGPRLDALSVFCMRRFGWMELGFQRDFLLEALRREGWQVAVHLFPGCGRAEAYLCEPAAAPGPATWHTVLAGGAGVAQVAPGIARHLLAALELSPLRALARPLRSVARRLRRRPAG
jgi:SAM-dependent methyltransferase